MSEYSSKDSKAEPSKNRCFFTSVRFPWGEMTVARKSRIEMDGL